MIAGLRLAGSGPLEAAVILPADAPLWELFENTVESVLKSYGYQKLVTPIVEETGLFARAIGAVTDIVEKEMYSFEDSMNGDRLPVLPRDIHLA